MIKHIDIFTLHDIRVNQMVAVGLTVDIAIKAAALCSRDVVEMLVFVPYTL